MAKEVTPFEKLVYAACRKIPRGKVSTYQEIARAIGRPKSARAVGNALNMNPFTSEVPCHRVVRSDGTLGGFAWGGKKKADILKKESLRIKNGKIINFERAFVKLK